MSRHSDISAARSVAFDLLRSVLARRRTLDDALVMHDGYRRLPNRDKGFARLVVATTLRRIGQIDALIDMCIEHPLPRNAAAIRDILRLASAEMLFLGIAAYASVDSAVEMVDSRQLAPFKGLTNAVLRRLSREGALMLVGISETRNVPSWMLDGWTETYGGETTGRIVTACLREAALDISVKSDPEVWAGKLDAVLLPTGSLRCRTGGPVPGLPGFEDGAWWVQDAAAALPVRLLGDVRGQRVLDLCAAPGGKTAQLLAAGARVTAVDRSANRIARLRRNLARLGLSAETKVADATEWQPDSRYDAVILDPPCSGTGTLRRHPDILHLKSASDMYRLVHLQDRLLKNTVSMVKPGGRIVFCTCSLQPDEGEQRLAALLAAGAPIRADRVRAAEVGGLTELLTSEGAVRTLPIYLEDLGGLDRFYAVRMIRH